DENVHLVRGLMDEVFGSENFVSLITVKKTSLATGQFLGGVTDYLVWYARDIERLSYREVFGDKEVGGTKGLAYDHEELEDGTRRRLRPGVSSSGRVFRYQILTSARIRENRTGYYPVEFEGKSYLPQTREWSTNREGMARLIAANRVAS